MNLFYFVGSGMDKEASLGIYNKIIGQIEALKKCNYKIDLCYTENDTIIIQDTFDYQTILCEKVPKKRQRSSKANQLLKFVAGYLAGKSYDVAYIRSGALSYYSLFFFSLIKRYIKLILIEFPTYPYSFEMLSNASRMGLIEKTRLFRRVLIDMVVRWVIRAYVDYIVLTIPKNSLWGIPVISIENAINIESVSLRNKPEPLEKIRLFAATHIATWQGLDRVVYGLHEYEKRARPSNIVIKIAGGGPQKGFLTDLIKKLHLEDKIIFCGPLKGKLLDELFDEADIAIGSLGRHRQKTNLCSTLKVKEYCGKGVPFIYSNDEPTLTGNEPFALKLAADESPVDFNKVVEFVYETRRDPKIPYKMRKFAEDHYDWTVQMKKIHKNIFATLDSRLR